MTDTILQGDDIGSPVGPGTYPVFLCTNCHALNMSNIAFRQGFSRYSIKLKRCTATKEGYKATADVIWFSSHDHEKAQTKCELQLTGGVSYQLNKRWQKYKPVVNAYIANMHASGVTIRTRFSDGSTCDYYTENRYTVSKCRDILTNMLYREPIDESNVYMHSHLITDEHRETLKRVLKCHQRPWFTDPDEPVSWYDVKASLLYPPVDVVVSMDEALEAGIIKHLPMCNNSKPFARGASLMERVQVLDCVLSSELDNDTANLFEIRKAFPDITCQKLRELIRDKSPMRGSFFTDSYGNMIICVAVAEVKETSHQKVLERYKKQDERM